jgi:hypothetical protein
MASAEKFCLRWNDFEANISSAFRELREDKDFFDVTLACDDDQIQAHKVILSACSPFFRTVLRRNRHEHPLLYLKGVKYVDLVAVLNFMYHGEVNVAQEELNSFLAVAEDLKVKGLTQNNSEKNNSRIEPPRPRPRDPPERQDPLPPPKRPRPSPQPFSAPSKPPSYPEDDDIQEVVPVKSEPVSIAPDPMLNNSVSDQGQASDFGAEGVVADPNMDSSALYGGEEYADYGNYEEGDGSLLGGAASADGNKEPRDFLIRDEDPVTSFRCKLCSYQSRQQSNALRHVKFMHLGHSENVFCHICHKTFTRKANFNEHVRTVHREHLSNFSLAQETALILS